MQNIKILNSREVKKILALLKLSFGFEDKLGYCFLMNNKNKIYLINKDISKIDLDKIRVNSIGLYFAEIGKGGIRLSIEGSRLIGDDCSANILKITAEDAKVWLQGLDLEINLPEKVFVIIKSGEDYLGCGKAVEGKILNFVPKNRRLKSIL